MLRVAVAAAWLYQLEPEHRLGVTLAPGPTWSRSGCFLHLFFPLLLCICGFLLFPFFCRESSWCQGNASRAPGLS